MDASYEPRLLREIWLSSKYRTQCLYSQISRNGLVFNILAPNQGILIIDTTGKTDTRNIPLDCPASTFVITGDGRKIVGLQHDPNGVDKYISIWDATILSAENNSPQYRISKYPTSQIRDLSWDNKKIFLFSRDYEISAHNIEDGSLIVSSTEKADRLIIISTPKGERLYATIHTEEERGRKKCIKIFDLNTKEKLHEHPIEFHVHEIRDTSQGNEFLMLVENDDHNCVVLLVVESSTKLWTMSLISNASMDAYEIYGFTYAETTDGAILAFESNHGIILQDSFGNQTEFANSLQGDIGMEFTYDGKKLIVVDQNAIRVYDSRMNPFWDQALHSRFKGEQKKSISFLFYANRILSKRKKRKKSVISLLPREMMLHILSFVKRDY